VIGRLKGVLLMRKAPELLLDVGGVGYELEASMTTFYDLPEVGSELTLHTHLVVREDAQLLYGFYTENERLMFRTLIKVRGVGAKLALAILSGMSTLDFVRCINDDNVTALVKLPGVGKKTAERLIIELRDKVNQWDSLGGEGGASLNDSSPLLSQNRSESEAVDALIALGYKDAQATRLVKSIKNPEGGESELSSEEMIRLALQQSIAL
jgi:Holliday junction DNA helicase RuvA